MSERSNMKCRLGEHTGLGKGARAVRLCNMAWLHYNAIAFSQHASQELWNIIQNKVCVREYSGGTEIAGRSERWRHCSQADNRANKLPSWIRRWNVRIETVLTLPMRRPLSSKAQGCKDFWYPLDSYNCVLSDEYPFARVSVIFQDHCIILYWPN